MPKTSDAFKTFYKFNKVNDKNVIVFIHGVGLTNEMWNYQLDFFKDDYSVLTYDLLGHGETPIKKTKFNFDQYSKQLLNLINELNLNKIHLVGFSLGALIARDFASKHSDRLSSLIIHASIYKRSEEQKRVVINRFNIAKMDKPASKKQALRRWFNEDFIKKNPETYKKIYLNLETNNLKNFLKSYELFVNYQDDDKILKTIDANTLITTGENDVGSTPEMASNLSKKIKNSNFITIKKGKHLCSIECSNDVNITFKKFIDKNND